jgi:signal transduction histidine kinase
MWTSDENGALEHLCSDIIGRIFDPTLPWFTENGSLWSGDLTKTPLGELASNTIGRTLGLSIGKGSLSAAIIPVESGSDRIGLLELESVAADFFSEQQIESYESVAQTLGIALSHRRLQEELRERVKELTCLYGIAKLVARPEFSLQEVLQSTVELLPPGWLYPDICCARIELDDRIYTTPGFRRPEQSLKADILVEGQERGFVEVGYVWEKPLIDEGPFLNEERNLIDTIAQEISVIVEQNQVESEKLKLQEQLLHADRLATIGQLGAGLAHELNEPLANILGFAQLAAKDQGLTGQTMQDIEKIVSASLHAREVIAKLLVFARETTLQKTAINLNALIEDGLHFLQSRCAKAGIELSRNLSKELPKITADRSQLLQVLTNLIVNSIQAMPDGGRLKITTDRDGDHVLLVVEDSGCGINNDLLQKIFDPFFTTKDVDQGTGLGLSVVHGIVRSHGGTIEVKSKVGQGTTFVVRIPSVPAATTKKKSHG